MGYIGIEKEGLNLDDVKKILEDSGLKINNIDEVEIKTKNNWKTFIRFEVLGFIEGYGPELSKKFNRAVFEWGEHTILGEVSAKLWHESVKIYYPDGDSEVIEVRIHDGFLDLILPTENIRGIKGSVVIGGLRIELPINGEQLFQISRLGDKAIRKLEKVVEIYGKERVLSESAIILLELAKRSEEKEEIDIDYETGFVIKRKGKKIITVPLWRYILNLIDDERFDEAKEILEKAPQETRNEIVEELQNELEISKVTGKPVNNLEKFLISIKKSGKEKEAEKDKNSEIN